MIDFKLENDEINRLRFVFDDDVVSLRFASDATLEDIAGSLEALVTRHDTALRSIDVTLAAT
jgi:hypothetical protein